MDMILPRLTARVFTDLAIWMMSFGLVIGLVFPPFLTLLGLPPAAIYTPLFITTSVLAGLFVGMVNYILVNVIVRPRLRTLSSRMDTVREVLSRSMREDEDWDDHDHRKCHITVDSVDEIGQTAQAFNGMIETLKKSRELSSAAQAFSRALSSDLELSTLGERGLDLMLRYSGVDAGAIYIEEDGELQLLASHAVSNAESLGRSAFLLRAMRTEDEVHVHLPMDVEVDALLTTFRPREILIVPIRYKKKAMGVILLATGDQFTDKVKGMMELFRQGLSLAVNNAVIHSQLQRIAVLDALTGAYNRRFGMQRLKEEFSRAQRTDMPLGVMMFDIDHFKSINDTYGHMIGDRVLIEVSRRAQQCLREGDVLVRYGGEEFLLILPGAACDDCAQIAERLLRSIRESGVREDGQQIQVTVSVGYTAYPRLEVASADEMVQTADEALYEAKHGGRNCAVAA